MRGPGILWMLQTAAGFSMAGPMFFLGIESLRTGQYSWGIGYLTLGALVLYFPTYLVNRIGGPRTWVRRRLDRWRGDAGDDSASADADAALEEESEATADAETAAAADSETATESTNGSATIFDRFRR